MSARMNDDSMMRPVAPGGQWPLRWAVLALLAVLPVACGGSDRSASTSPVLRILDDQILVDNAVGSPGSQMSPARLSSMAYFEFQVVGQLPAFGGPGSAYVIEPTEPSTGQLDRLRSTFGVSESFSSQSPEVGGGLMAGPTDGTAPMISVMDDVMRTWSYSPAWADSVIQDCVETPVDEGTGEISTACAPTNPPENLPSQSEAREMFAALMDELDVSSEGLVIETTGDEWGITVNGFAAIDGVRSPFTWSVTYGENGSIVSAFGVLNDSLRNVGEYPRLSIEDALARLQTEQDDAARRNGIEPVNGIVAEVTSAEEELYILYGADGEVYLVPGYTFIGTVDVDNYALRFIVSALPDEFVEKVAVPVASGGDSDGGADVASTDAPPFDAPVGEEIPLDQANELLGLTEAAATAEAESRNWTVRIAARDGEQFALTMDYSPTRVNLTVENDLVTYLFVG